MLTLGGGTEAKVLRNRLRALFRDKATQKVLRRLTVPPHPAFDALLHWVDLGSGRGIWARFGNLKDNGNWWSCWYGVSLGDSESESLVPAIEINLPTLPDLRVAGRVLVDEHKKLYLGHRGGLGGGRSGNMSVVEFCARIQGFVREEFTIPSRNHQESAFLIAADDDTDLIDRLQHYVSECARLRAEKRLETAGATSQHPGRLKHKGQKKNTLAFNPEAATDGTGTGLSLREIKRLHGRVVNALQSLVPDAVNSHLNDMQPDLYLMHRNRLSVLFEVKVTSDTQSWFTAIGQLMVYSNGQQPPPRLLFVCPTDRRHPAFRSALDRLGILLVTFSVDDTGHITFSGLDEALSGLP